MKTHYLLFGMLTLALVACGPNKKAINKTIEEEEHSLSMVDIASEDERAHNLVDLYLEYAKAFPQDSLAPLYLFRASDISTNLGDYDKSIELLDQIIEDYSDFNDIAICYFLKGFTYEQAERYDDARAAYNAFLELFPDHFLAEAVKQNLPYVGQTTEQMFETVMNQSNDENLTIKKNTNTESQKKK